ncbi:MAG TPA: Nudix family hydrolase [Rhodocyclaceae bacterium]|nr:Nudix family hydrolase [Rhodocyclaceae bacterium]
MKITQVAAAVIERPDGSFLLGQRAPDTFYPGYWEFPGGKVEPGETPRDALVRELREELEIEVLQATPWIVREHVYEHAHVRLHFFRVSEWRGEVRDHVHAALEWQRPGATTVTPMLPANAPVLAALDLPDFYGITHAQEIGVDAQLATLEHSLKNGLRLVQLRESRLPADRREPFAAAAVALCQRHSARVLVNGDAQLAWAVGADGLHLTGEQLKGLRGRPNFPLVAASCHDAAELKRAAEYQLDFAVLGAVKPTASHPGREGIGWPAVAKLLESYPLPVYAIGGLGREDLDSARAAGAHGIAAIRAAWV